jgi:phage tail protein X
MTIQSNSRYVNASTSVLTVNNNDRQVIVPGSPQTYMFNYQSYQITGADTLDSLAYAFYGDPSAWWMICDANPEIMNWQDMTPLIGYIIRVPNTTAPQ